MRAEVHDELAHHQVAEDPHLVAVGDDIVPVVHHGAVQGVRVRERARCTG